tara:strand:- start:2290 stop:3816 length:1527 start_codon:yes stop_codon:yes gene_type:complete
MTFRSELILGPPGCGKTHTLIEIVRKALSKGIDLDRIGYVSFTKKAVNEAVERAGSAFNLAPKDLPYFRTLHSLGYNGLGLSQADLMSREDWREFSRQMGMNFDGITSSDADDGLILPQGRDNDRYLRMIDRAALRCVSIEKEFNDQRSYDLHFFMLEKIDKALRLYKSENGKVSFTDMISKYIEHCSPPKLEILIVDEAQDLVPLQWRMVEKLASNSEYTYFAGDDDQAIHKWAGVDVNLFMKCSETIRVLDKSYRLPKSAFDLSMSVVQRIRNRQQKTFKPTEREGSVNFHLDTHDIDMSQGSWTLMTRTNSFARDIASDLRDQGLFYEIKGFPSVKLEIAEAVKIWEGLQKGDEIGLHEVRRLYELAPKTGDGAIVKRGMLPLLDAEPLDSTYTYESLVKNLGLLAPREVSALDVLRLGTDEKYYIRSLLRRKEVLTERPRLKISTFHAMKGGEDDNVVVHLDSTKPCVTNPDQDDEHRVFYVGLTRVKKNLHIIESQKKYRYDI